MTLTLSLSAAGAADTTTTGAGAYSGEPSAYHSDSDALLTYSTRGRRASLGVSAQSVFRYDPGRGGLSPMGNQGTFDFSVAGPRTRLHATQSVSYSPSYQFGAWSEASTLPLTDTARSHGDYGDTGYAAYGSGTAVDLARSIGRRATLSLSYSVRHTAFASLDGFTAHAIGIRLTRRLTPHASLRAGYGRQFGGSRATSAGPARVHDIDLGIDYSRALSFSRRTSVSFGSGSSVLTEDRGTAYRVSADASLTREIGRTGSARLAYRRGVQLLEGFAAPVMFDTISAGLTGSLSRRVALSSSLGLSSGTVGSATGGPRYGTLTGAAGLHLTLSRRAAFDVQYFSYRQRFADGVVLSPGLASGLNRQGVRAGVSWGASLLH